MAFEELPVAVQRRVLQQQLVGAGVASDFELVERLRVAPGKLVSVGSGWSVARDVGGKVQQTKSGGHFDARFNADELKLKLSGRAGRVEFGGGKFRWQIRPQNETALPQKKAGVEFFDADRIGGEIILRHWRAGDRFQPIGMRSPAKLQDLFVNAKIPAARRRELVLAVTVAGEIFWVEGLRIGEKFRLMPVTKRRLRWDRSKIAA
jgi:tRNA(Ile)-lysidine synthase